MSLYANRYLVPGETGLCEIVLSASPLDDIAAAFNRPECSESQRREQLRGEDDASCDRRPELRRRHHCAAARAPHSPVARPRAATARSAARPPRRHCRQGTSARKLVKAATKRRSGSSRRPEWAASSSRRRAATSASHARRVTDPVRSTSRPAGQGRRRHDHVCKKRQDARRAAQRDVHVLPLEGLPSLLEGQRARDTRRPVHRLPQGDGRRLAPCPARASDRDRNLCDLPPPEARPADALVPHAAARRRDDVHLVPAHHELERSGITTTVGARRMPVSMWHCWQSRGLAPSACSRGWSRAGRGSSRSFP